MRLGEPMAGPLRNHRHEAFVQLLLKGESAIDAHEKAGFARSDANSSRLKASPRVRERLGELQSEIAKWGPVITEAKIKLDN